ncbi:MAG: hypothetical protein QXX08_05470 [Candidatus Bathyarchaeia archaeon]
MSRLSEVEGLAKFGLFLFLAFILPGMIYVGFITLYYSDVLRQFGWDLNSWVGFLGLSVFFGLLITSVCFALENLIYYLLEKCLALKKPKIIMLGIFEVRDKRTFYLNQLVGQYICHFNIGLGVLLLTLAYPLYLHITNTSSFDLLKFIFGILISIVNLYLSLGVFRIWSVEAIEKYEKESQASHKN